MSNASPVMRPVGPMPMMPTLANVGANSATCDKRSGTEVRVDSEKAKPRRDTSTSLHSAERQSPQDRLRALEGVSRTDRRLDLLGFGGQSRSRARTNYFKDEGSGSPRASGTRIALLRFQFR